MTYHYHFVATQLAYEALQAALPSRASDRTLEIRNSVHNGQRYVAWKLSKVEYTNKVDAVIRVIEALYPGLVHSVTKADDKPLAEPFSVPIHSNYDVMDSVPPLDVWYERVTAEDSLEKFFEDLNGVQDFVAVLKQRRDVEGRYKWLIKGYQKVLEIVRDAVEDTEDAEHTARLALGEVKLLLVSVDNAERTQHPSPYIIRDLRTVYIAAFNRLHKIVFGTEKPATLSRYTLAELKALPTITVGQDADLKIETDNLKVWLSRMSFADGAPYPNQVTVNIYRNNQWETIAEYQAR